MSSSLLARSHPQRSCSCLEQVFSFNFLSLSLWIPRNIQLSIAPKPPSLTQVWAGPFVSGLGNSRGWWVIVSARYVPSNTGGPGEF